MIKHFSTYLLNVKKWLDRLLQKTNQREPLSSSGIENFVICEADSEKTLRSNFGLFSKIHFVNL